MIYGWFLESLKDLLIMENHGKSQVNFDGHYIQIRFKLDSNTFVRNNEEATNLFFKDDWNRLGFSLFILIFGECNLF